MTTGGHASEEALERFCLGSASATELEGIESHLLVCTACQDRLRETERYVRTMQQATAQAVADQLARQARWRQLREWVFRSLPATAIAAAVALALVWGFAPSIGPAPGATPVAVALDLARGDESPRAHAPALRPLLLKLDLKGVAALDSYQVRIVDARGGGVLDATAKPDHERLSVPGAIRLGRGTYWVRLYDPSDPQTPLREYGLALE
jgi:anti-sigma factor RsiW